MVSPRVALCLPMLFNIVVDVVVWEWMQQLQQEGDYDKEQVAEFMATFFAIFLC